MRNRAATQDSPLGSSVSIPTVIAIIAIIGALL